MKISACILTKNEEDTIERCLQNVAPYVDEVVIVDGYSEDNTVEIARKYMGKIYQREFSGSFAVERNYSIENAMGDWIFIVAPDEVPTKSLLTKLRELTNQSKYDAYSFIRKDVMPNGEVLDLPCGFPKIDLRLAKRTKMRYYGAIHERAVVFGKAKFIPEIIHHHRGYTIDYPAEKAERFKKIAETAKQRDQGLDLSRSFLIRRGLKLIILYFFNMLIGLKLYKEGVKGLLLSIRYTVRFTFYGVSQYKKQGQI
jgi:glycosyltransferase involved in cell wall biosynthesis